MDNTNTNDRNINRIPNRNDNTETNNKSGNRSTEQRNTIHNKMEQTMRKNKYLTQQRELDEDARELYEYNKRINSIFAAQKRLFRKKRGLTTLNDPILFLESTSGDIKIYENVKGGEFKVPGLEEGVEKTIILGRKYQVEIPYGRHIIRAYWCHEDWAFPHLWSKPNVYTGEYPQLIKNFVHDPTDIKNRYPKGIPMILESANVNAEAMRDRERKVFILWEGLKAKSESIKWAAWAKIALYILGGAALILFVWLFFGDKIAPQAVTTVVSNATQGGILIG